MDIKKEQLEALQPQINHILRISGSPALSLGVLHRGAIIHTAHFGRRQAEESAPPDDDTIHWIASLTKLITVASVARLVHEGKLDWDVPIREYLPDFRIRQDELGLKASMRDLLSNRTGIAPANNLWAFQHSEPLMKKDEIPFTATYIPSAKPFGQFVYSQWNYALADAVVKKVTGTSLCDYIEDSVFRPLQMTRSSFARPTETDTNVAHAHGTHDDGTATRIADFGPCLVDTGIGAGAGARSSTHDYMIFLGALLSAFKHQEENSVDTTPGSIFPLTRTIFTPQVGMGPPQRSGIDSVAYCMGIYRTKLPGYLSIASPSFYYTLGRKRLPPYGSGELAGTDVFHHSGTGPGHLGAMFLVPSTESAVVAFTNSQPLNDPADFVAQLALAVLLGQKLPVDLVKMAQLARNVTLENYKVLAKAVAGGKTDVQPTKPLLAYVGDYYNAIHNFVLSVTLTGDCLHVQMQRGRTGFTLLPYDGDTFYWPVNREDETCAKAMWGFMYKDWHLFRFVVDANGEVEGLAWKHDPYITTPEMFRKTPALGTFARL